MQQPLNQEPLYAVHAAVAALALRCYEAHAEKDPARIGIVYDEGSTTVFPLTVGLLPRDVESAYRAKITADTDRQLLWNPEEFPVYASKGMSQQIDAATSDAIHAAIAADADFYGQVKQAINHGCGDANDTLAGKRCIAFATDPELVDVRANVEAIGNIPAEIAEEMPDWF
ncbi:MAG TPA: hypothetical protein VLF18_11680 [Tahibacter sp.]|uniref:hypothetical protein n=1 Tax=Tahibacter sp. TaxID=2056211 RepID=UPI002B56F2C5|nr:hypothetical protein [Tahibacter sp.]HSX60851.1 hypothetical protein [Tahibacter sp.]